MNQQYEREYKRRMDRHKRNVAKKIKDDERRRFLTSCAISVFVGVLAILLFILI